MKARDIMTSPAITIGPEATVEDLAERLTGQRISGLPVVDTAGRLIGVVTEADVMIKTGACVADIMTANAITVSEDTSVEEVAMILAGRRIKRVPVMRGSELVGVVSRADIVRAVARRTWRPDHIVEYTLAQKS